MRLLSLVVASCATVAVAHEGPAFPKLVGASTDFLSQLRRRTAFAERSGPTPEHKRDFIGPRQSTRCGQGKGSCSSGQCCSAEGYCGTGKDFCSAPDCQINYSTGCDALKKPSGKDTSTISRTKVGSVLYGGVGISSCAKDVSNRIALTFDDGPWDYTSDLLDKLKQYKAKATFFVTGNNLGKGAINDQSKPWPALLKRMIAEGHQIASHTWSHQNQSQLTTSQYKDQIIWNEIAIADVLGYFPTYMRPPYSICDKNCQSTLSDLGYHIVYFDLDTQGYLNDAASTIQKSKDLETKALKDAATNYLQIEHDIHYQVVYNLTDFILEKMYLAGYRSVTVGDCVKDARQNWYRAAGGTVPTTAPVEISSMGDCGPGITCLGSAFGTCCSSHGYCGNDADYCGDSCQAEFGKCEITAATTPSDKGECGNGVTCLGFPEGQCCSKNGYCGNTDAHCGDGCQSGFGICGSSGITSANPPTTTSTAKPITTTTKPITTLKPITTTTTTAKGPQKTNANGQLISNDGRCGNNVTCLSSSFGFCCSRSGTCGSTEAQCGTGCQSDYGVCYDAPIEWRVRRGY